MTLVIKDRVLETCSSPGTGVVTLLGATSGYQSFSAAVGNGNTCYYTIADQSGSNWEVGIGTYTSSSNTLARTTVLDSSNGGTIVNFSSGTQNVFVTYPAGKVVTTDTLAYPPAIGGTTANTGAFTTLTASADSSFTSTGYLRLPKGTSGEQPGSPVTGMVRYNTTTNLFEGYSGAIPAWNALAGASITNDVATASFEYPLFASSTSGTLGTVYTSNSNYLYKPSTGELQAQAMTANNGIYTNSQAVAVDYTIAAGQNGLSAGPITVNSGITVTVSSGSTWVVA